MSRASPPEKDSGQSGFDRAGTGKKNVTTRRYVAPSRYAREHWLLTTKRLDEGLLSPFTCMRCGVIALDPHGWDGPHTLLCSECADCDFATPF
jgi:hypothetical protein